MILSQHAILKGALAAVVITTLFQPFIVSISNDVTIGIGYGFILSWPAAKANGNLVGHVDVALLIAEWISILLVSALLWLLNRDPKAQTLMGELLSALIRASRMDADTMIESARIHADATIRAAEITASRSAQLDLLDRHK